MGHKVNNLGIRVGTTSNIVGGLVPSIGLIGRPMGVCVQDVSIQTSVDSISSSRDRSSYRIGELKRVVSTSLLRQGMLMNRCNFEVEVDTISVYIDYYTLIKAQKWSKPGTGYVPGVPSGNSLKFDASVLDLTMSMHFGNKRVIWYWKHLRADKHIASSILDKLSAPRYDYAGDFISILSLADSTNVAPAIVELIKLMMTGSGRQTRSFGMYASAIAALLLVSDNLIGYSIVIKGPVDGKERSAITRHESGDNPKTDPTAPADHHHVLIVTADCVVGVSLTLYYS
jgi:hypothetical protein